MRIEKVRVQNFQCIRDSGEILIDNQLTVLVGANGSGKSAILRALQHFNADAVFKDVDVSTMSGEMRQKLHRHELPRDSVDMVSVWVALSEKDSSLLQLPPELQGISAFQITKGLDNHYKVLTADGRPLEEVSRSVIAATKIQLEGLVEQLQRSIANVYCGQVKRMGPMFDYTFLQKTPNEPELNNLYLSHEYADAVWDSLDEGDWVQVTKIANDPFGRNDRALNAGVKIDLKPALDELLIAVRTHSEDAKLLDAFSSFEKRVNGLPFDHPLKDYVTEDLIVEIDALIKTAQGQDQAIDVDKAILDQVPVFVHLSTLDSVPDHAPTTILSPESSNGESEHLLATVLNAAGFNPKTYVESDPATKLKYQTDAKDGISQLLREYWVRDDLTVEFDVYDVDGQQSVGIAVVADGSVDPPSRRSQGLQSFLSLFALLTAHSARRNVVLLLDDPAVHLHPVAQKKLLNLLDKQPYQMVLATHLPFMIDAERLERVRVVKRTLSGTQIEHDWAKAQEDLLPVWGALLGNLSGTCCLLVEGKRDREYYTLLSRVCRKAKREHLDASVGIIPGGGGQLPHAARALNERGVFVVCLLDGDRQGEIAKKQLQQVFGANSARIVTLSQVIENPSPEVEDLFSPEFQSKHDVRMQGLPQVLHRLGEESEKYDETTLNNFEECFRLINEAIQPIK